MPSSVSANENLVTLSVRRGKPSGSEVRSQLIVYDLSLFGKGSGAVADVVELVVLEVVELVVGVEESVFDVVVFVLDVVELVVDVVELVLDVVELVLEVVVLVVEVVELVLDVVELVLEGEENSLEISEDFSFSLIPVSLRSITKFKAKIRAAITAAPSAIIAMNGIRLLVISAALTALTELYRSSGLKRIHFSITRLWGYLL